MAEPTLLLDASAFLALIQGEAGAERVAQDLDRAAISAVNLAESAEIIARRGAAPDRALGWVGELALPVLPFDAAMAAAAGRLLHAHRRAGLSLGDAACLATAEVAGLAVLTADRAWLTLGLGVEIRTLR